MNLMGFAISLFLGALALSTSAQAQNFGGAFDGLSNSGEPVQIEADKLEVVDNENTAILTGNVSVVQGTTILKAGRIKVTYLRNGGSENGGIRTIEASGGRVAVRSGENKATADKAVVNMQTEIVTMTGDVIISQGTNVVNGCFLKVNLKTNISEFKGCGSGPVQGQVGNKPSGRVKIVLQPKSGG